MEIYRGFREESDWKTFFPRPNGLRQNAKLRFRVGDFGLPEIPKRYNVIEMLVHVHVLANAQWHCSCVYRRSHYYRRSHMCVLECNVCGGITAVVLSRCRSLYLTLLWISLDLHGILAIVWTPAYSVISICVCWPPKRCVYNITSSSLLHRTYLLLLCCLLKVSQYRLALINTASVHIVESISQHIYNRS